jgi:cell wall-associated NlpC family hydrolase
LPAQLRAGDRLYFSASGSRVDHTGLYMGDGLFVHASGSGRQVMVSNLFTPRNWNIFVGARR